VKVAEKMALTAGVSKETFQIELFTILDCHATEVTVDGEPSKDQFPLNAQYTPHKAIQLQLADAEARCEQLEEKLSQAPQRVHANLEGTSLPATQDMAKLKQQVNDLMSEVSEANIARQQAEANSQLLMRPAFCDNGSEHIAPPMDVLGEVGLFLVKCYDLDRIGLEENSVGLGYRCSPNLEDRRGSQYPDVVPETYVPWGSVVTASSVGENWVKTEQGYLPIKLRGETVLSKMEGVQLNESVAGRFFEERRGISLDIAEINEDSSCFKDVPVSVQYAAAPPVQYAAAPPVQYAAAPPVMNAAAPTLSAASAVYSEAELPEQPKASELADALGDSLEDLRGIAQKHSDEVSAMMEALDASKATHAQQMEELSLSLRAATSHNEQLQADIVRLQEQKDTGADDQLELAAVSAAKQAMEHELFGATARIGELQEDLHHMTQEAEKIQRMDDERRRHETTIQTLTEQQHRLEEDLHHAHSDRGAMQVHCVSFEEELVRFREENTSVLEEARRQGSQQATHEMDAACREATQRHARAEEAAEAYASRVSELEQGFAAKDEELREKADLHAGIIQDHREAAFVSEQRLRDHTAMLEEKIEQLQESSSLPMTPRASGAVEELSNALKAASMQNEQLQTEIVRLQWTHPQWKGASAANDPSSVAVREQNKAMDQELSRAHTQISLLQAELDDMAEAAEQVRCNDDERSSNEKAIQIVLAEHHQFEEALRNAHSDREAVQSRSVLFQEELLMLSEDKGNVELEKGRGQDVPHAVLSQLEAACLDATKRNAQAEHALATHASRTWELQQGFTERESELRHNALATERKLQDAEVNNELLTKEFQTKCAAVEHHEALHEQEKDSLRAQMRSLEAQVAAQATEFQQRLAATGVGTQELENVFMERLLLSEEKLRAADKKRTEMEGRAAMLENQFKIVKQTDELGKAEESDDRVMQMAGRMAEMQQEMAQIKLALQAGQVKSTSGDDETISQNALENAELKGRLAGAKDSVVNVTRKLEEERATMWEEMEQRTIQVGVTSRATVTCSNTLSNTLSPSMPMRKTSSPQSIYISAPMTSPSRGLLMGSASCPISPGTSAAAPTVVAPLPAPSPSPPVPMRKTSSPQLIYNSAPMTSPSRGLLMGSASFPISPGTSAAAPTVVAPLPAPSATSAYPPVTWNHLTGTRDVQTTPYSSRSHLDVPSALGSSRGGTASHVGTVYAGGGTGSARGPISARVIAGGIGGQNNVGPTMVVHRSPLEGPSQTQQLAQQPLQAGGPFLGRIEGDRTWMVAHMPQR